MRHSERAMTGGPMTPGVRMPGYVLVGAYALLAIGVVGCLAFIASSFEDEDPAPKRVDRDGDGCNGRPAPSFLWCG